MFITVDDYEEMYLKGHSAEEILAETEKLRREIAKTKRKAESPSYIYNAKEFPTVADTVAIYRNYLARAVAILSDTWDVCALTEEDKASAIFDSMIDSISCLTLTAGVYLQDKYEIIISGEEALLSNQTLGAEKVCKSVDKDKVLSSFRALFVGEWESVYVPENYGCTLNEPTKWQLRIDYCGTAAPRFYDGFGIFPYNFRSLQKIFEADII